MDLEEIKRGLRGEIKKRENEQYFTFQTNIRQMCKDVLAKLEEQESEIAELKSENRRLKRALWLARAERANENKLLWDVYCHCDKLYFCKSFCVSTRKNPYRYISRMNVVEWDEFWGKIKNKCLAKAEEY